MILTKEQTISFLQDNSTVADTTEIGCVERNIERIVGDEAVFTLVVKIENKYYRGSVRYYDEGGSFSEGDLTYKPGFYDDFQGMELKEVHKVPKVIEVWEDVE